MDRNRGTRLKDWALGRSRPSRPPDAQSGVVPGPEGLVGIACSGGGIRSASFNLGALQVLRERDVLQHADYLAAVSGGSYIAASHAIVAAHSAEQLGDVPPFAAGSPEERWVRNHSTYMAPNATVKLRAVLNLLYGLVANVSMLLVVLFVVARPLGWTYSALLPGLADPGEPALEVSGWTGVIIAGLVGTAFLLVYAERQIDRRRRSAPRLTAFLRAWSTRVVVASGIVAVLLVAVPLAVLGLWEAGQADVLGGAVREVLTRLGFSGGAEGSAQVQLPVLLAALGVLLGVVTRTVKTASGLAGSRVGRFLLPHAGSLLVSLVLVLPFLKWTRDAAIASSWRDELLWEVGALVALALHTTFSNVNRTSMHPFYKERLCSAFAIRRESATEAGELPYSVALPFSAVKTTGVVPELLVCAAANVSDLDDVPPGRGCVSFTFSATECGAPALGPYVDTAAYERIVGRRTLTLPGAVAMSGAAVSPVMGRMTRPALRVLLTLANVRLGVWLPNPARQDTWPPEERADAVSATKRRQAEPGPGFLLREMLGRNRWDDPWIYVSDGGHWENLGVLELLRRGCTTVFVLDASGDAVDRFTTLGQAVALARADLGVEVDIDPSCMAIDPETGWARSDHCVGSIRYADGRRGTIAVAKLAVTAKAPWDVRAYQAKDPVFPHHPTFDQLYADERFEAYRSLGRHAAGALLDSLRPAEVVLSDDLPHPRKSREHAKR